MIAAQGQPLGIHRSLAGIRAAIAVDRTHVSFGQRLDLFTLRLWVVEVEVEQAAPTTSNAHHFVAGIDGAIDHRLDTRVEPRHITTKRCYCTSKT